ncbi:MAG TPA: OmpA family protein, partial [Vicinamibacterales bacterium]|nr:OmpA family protein [Vicinamibacterales bacterium]
SGVTPPTAVPNDMKAAQAMLERAAEHLRQALARLPSFKLLEDRIEITVTPEGLRIELLETAKNSFFAVGSADLLPETVEILAIISQELGTLGYPIALEGHTDSRAYSKSTSYGNWELSTDRANAARRAMERFGLRPGQIIAVRGYADTRLRTPDSPYDARNRRISILVTNNASGN